MLKEIMLEKKIWAVVGANNNPDKFGNMIFKRLVSKGYKVYPVNPLCDEVDGHRCYKDLSSLPEKPEVIDMVVSPKRGNAYLEEAVALGIKNIWLQPGTYDDALMAYAAENGLNTLQACVLVEIP